MGPAPELRFVLLVLAVWRLTHLLAAEDGPWDVMVGIRRRLGTSVLGHLMDCFYCLSLWIAAPLALLVARELLWWAVAWLALSGGASLLERATERDPWPVGVLRTGGRDELLWTEAPGDATGDGRASDPAGGSSEAAGPGETRLPR